MPDENIVEVPEEETPTPERKKPGRKPKPKAEHSLEELKTLPIKQMSEVEKDMVLEEQKRQLTLLRNQNMELERSVKSINEQYKAADAAYCKLSEGIRQMQERLRTVLNSNTYAISAILENGVKH